jgi:STE24 endopeptidase
MFPLVLVFVVLFLSFGFESFLSVLNDRRRNDTLPDSVKDVYDADRYRKWQAYAADSARFQRIKRSVHYGMVVLALTFGLFGLLGRFAEALTSSELLRAWLFLGLYSLVFGVKDGIFEYFRRFRIDAKHGLNQSTKKTFVRDMITQTLLTVVLGGGIVAAVITPLTTGKIVWYAVVFVIAIVVQTVIFVLYVPVFLRLFNKLTPLPDGTLKDRILELVKNAGFTGATIRIADASRRSTRLNAFFSGFGKAKQIVLYDTLLQAMSEDEILAVLAHEVGHGVHKDVAKNLVRSFATNAAYLIFLWGLFRWTDLTPAFGLSSGHFGMTIVLFSILISPFADLLTALTSWISRKAEFAADAYSKSLLGQEPMIGALKVLARANFAHLTPHPLVVKLTYTHPPIAARIEALRS